MDQISINKIVEEKWKQEKAKIEEDWKSTETLIREEWKFTEARMEEKLRQARLGVEEKLEQTETRIRTEIMMSNQRISAENSMMKLQFKNKISQPILTGEELKGEGNTCIEVSLVNNSTGNIVDVGPESSASVDIVVLKQDFDRDDWTVEEFNEKIVHQVQGKRPLLEGSVHVNLLRGRGVLGKVKFKHHVTKMKPRPEFRLGARLNGDLSINGIFVKEAKTESFIVKGFRNKYFKKHEIPSLSDEVWRLRNIRKGGKIDQRLQNEKIYNVEGLLIRFLKDPEGLKNVVGLCLTKWEAIVKHARMCPSGDRRYCYIDSQQKTGIVFDILGQVLGLYSEGSSAINMPENKAAAEELLSSAINHWGDVVSFDDENSVNQYFTRIMSVDHSNPPGSQYHGHGSTKETPIISNSSSSNQGIISNSTKEIGLRDSAYFPLSIYEYDMDILHDSPFKLSPFSNLGIETMVTGSFDEEFTPDHCGLQQYKDFVEATNVESGILFVAPSEVAIPICKAPKRYWRKLSHASRLFCVRKKKIVGS